MATQSFLVLRVRGGDQPLRDPFETSVRGERVTRADGPIEYHIDEEQLDDKDQEDIRRSEEVKAVAVSFPVKLIEPMASTHDGGADPFADGATWGVRATGALRSPYFGAGVTVAVLDTGIDAGHEAFRGLEVIERDFTGEGDGDVDGHGTHVAATIFGRPGAAGRYSLAPGVRRALIGKIIGADRSATTKEIAGAIQWAVDEGASVINMSVGFDFPGQVQQLVDDGMPADLATSRALAAYRDNVRLFDATLVLLRAQAPHGSSALVVAAAGNESRRGTSPTYTIEVSPPAAADGMVAVAALGSTGAPHTSLSIADFSNIRPAVAAPGVGIYSARLGGGYESMDGTSMASPHVAGVAALWAERQIQRNGIINISALDAQLRGHARRDSIGGARYLDVGEGLVMAPLD